MVIIPIILCSCISKDLFLPYNAVIYDGGYFKVMVQQIEIAMVVFCRRFYCGIGRYTILKLDRSKDGRLQYKMTNSRSTAKIGLLFSETGATSIVENSQRKGALLAINQINESGGVLGRQLEVLSCDSASDATAFFENANYLLDMECVALFGCYMSSSRKAVLPVVEKRNSLLFYPTLYEGFEFSRNCIYTGASPNQSASVLANFLTRNFKSNYVFVGSDYVFPYEINRIMLDLLTSQGAIVKEEIYIPLNATDDEIIRVVKKVKQLGEVIVFSSVVGDAAITFAREYHAAGFNQELTPVVSLTFSEIDAKETGGKVSNGYIRVAPYFSETANVANKKFVDEFKIQYGPDEAISAETEAAYSQMWIFAEAVKRAGSFDFKNIINSISTFTIEAPQGPIQVEKNSQHTYIWPKIAICNEHGKFEIVEESKLRIKPDPYMINYDSAKDVLTDMYSVRGVV